MPDFHHNIFYYYRGAKQKNFQFERQLEDNTTKALINTLEFCSPKVSNNFLNWLAIENQSRVSYELQRKTIGDAKIKSKSKRIVLGIVPSDKNNRKNGMSENIKYDSRPDAWIYGSNFVILIESKVIGFLDDRQMKNHCQKLKTNINDVIETKVVRWSDIHKFFYQLNQKLNDTDRFIVNQFVQYLGWINMSEFLGFKTEFFDYFISRNDEEVRKWVHQQMQSFAEKFQSLLIKLDPFYEGIDVGVLKKTDPHTWVAFGPKNKHYRQYAHLTLVANSSGLEVLINIELKSATDKLKKKITNHSEEFLKLLLNMNVDKPLTIQLEERVQKQASLYDYNRIINIDVNSLIHKQIGKSSFEYLKLLLYKIPYPYFTIRKMIDRDEVCKLSENEQVDLLFEKVYSICENYHSLIKFINE